MNKLSEPERFALSHSVAQRHFSFIKSTMSFGFHAPVWTYPSYTLKYFIPILWGWGTPDGAQKFLVRSGEHMEC